MLLVAFTPTELITLVDYLKGKDVGRKGSTSFNAMASVASKLLRQKARLRSLEGVRSGRTSRSKIHPLAIVPTAAETRDLATER